MEKKTLDDNLKSEMAKVIREARETFLADRKANEQAPKTPVAKKEPAREQQKSSEQREPVAVK
jgi:hypothetical protein